MPEWSNGLDSKSCVRATVPRVRIPLSPLFNAFSTFGIGFCICFNHKDLYLCMINEVKNQKMTILIAQFDDATKLEKVIALFKSLKIPFQFKPTDAAETDDIVWDWEDIDEEEFSKFTISQISDGWDHPDNDHWDNY
jgi:hypothetical protein